jgi:hypothetical protein
MRKNTERDPNEGGSTDEGGAADLCACLTKIGAIFKKFQQKIQKIPRTITKRCALAASYLVRQRRAGTGRGCVKSGSCLNEEFSYTEASDFFGGQHEA